MIPQYPNNLEQVRRFRSDTVQPVSERVHEHEEQSLFSSEDCVLDLSKYLTSADVSTSPQGYFPDFFDVDKMRSGNNNFVKVKEEPIDGSNSRCSTPDSFVPDEFEKQDFPSPTFQPPTTTNNNIPHFNNNNLLLRTTTPLHSVPAPFQGAVISSIPGTSAIQAALQNVSHNKSAGAAATGSVVSGSAGPSGVMGGLKLPLFSQLQTIHQQRFPTINKNASMPNNHAANSFSSGNHHASIHHASLPHQLTSTASSIASSHQSSANTSDSDNSDEDMMTSSQLSSDMVNSLNAKHLQQALNELQDEGLDGSLEAHLKQELKQEPMDMDGAYPGFSHMNKLRPGGLFKGKQRKFLQKGSEEYVLKRERNNVAVRKSRTKAKLKHIETQMRVGELNEENSQLRNRINSLQKEVQTLKSFITYHIPNASTAGHMPSTTSGASSPISLTNSPVKSQHPPAAPPVSPVYSTFGGRNTGYSPPLQ